MASVPDVPPPLELAPTHSRRQLQPKPWLHAENEVRLALLGLVRDYD